jgi:peroxiredoxin
MGKVWQFVAWLAVGLCFVGALPNASSGSSSKVRASEPRDPPFAQVGQTEGLTEEALLAAARARARAGDVSAAALLLEPRPERLRRSADLALGLALLFERRDPVLPLPPPEHVAAALLDARLTVDVLVRHTAALERWAESEQRPLTALEFARALLADALDPAAPYDAWLALVRADDALTPSAARGLFERVERAHAVLVRDWLARWSQLGEEAPPYPFGAELAVMTELHEIGHGPATWWLYRTANERALPAEELAALRAPLLARLVERGVHEDWFVGAARGAPALVDAATRAPLLELLDTAARTTTNAEVRPWCLHASGIVFATTEPVDALRAAEYFERLALEHPDHELAGPARVEAWALRALRIGEVLPAHTRPDRFGRTFDLEARAGRIVVLAFLELGASDTSVVPVLEQLTRLHGRERFEVVVVSVDADVESARAAHVASGRDFEVYWQGSRGGAWPAAWALRSFPATFVIDATGRIRARDVRGAALSRAVLDLIGR